MKQDGRKLDRRTLEVIRKIAVRRVREGEKASEQLSFETSAVKGFIPVFSCSEHGIEGSQELAPTGDEGELLGFSRPVIYRWLKAANGRRKGLRTGLAPRDGCPRKLTARQERQIFRGINGKNPRQYQLEGVLGSRAIVRE